MSKRQRRYYRTIFLGLAAMATLVWAAMDQFGISRREMTDLFLGAVLAVMVVIAAAAVVAVAVIQLGGTLARAGEGCLKRHGPWPRGKARP